MDFPEPIRVRILQMIEVFFTAETRALGVLFKDFLVDQVLVIAERDLHLRAHLARPAEIFFRTPPRAEVFGVLVAGGLEKIWIPARDVVDIVNLHLLGACRFPPFVTPTIRATA